MCVFLFLFSRLSVFDGEAPEEEEVLKRILSSQCMMREKHTRRADGEAEGGRGTGRQDCVPITTPSTVQLATHLCTQRGFLFLSL